MKPVKIIVFFIGMMCFNAMAQTDPLGTMTLVSSNPAVQINSMAYGNGTFVGVGGGMRYLSHDGSNWIGYVNPPVLNQATIVYGNGIFLTFGTNTRTASTVIYESTNAVNWAPIYTNVDMLTSAAYGNNTWVFIGPGDNVAANVNGSTWSWTEYEPAYMPNAVIFANGAFVQLVYNNPGLEILTSLDGVYWQYAGALPGLPYNILTQSMPFGLAFANGIFAVSGIWSYYNQVQIAFISTNLFQWNENFSQAVGPNYFSYLTSIGRELFITGTYSTYNGEYFTSFDGVNWTGYGGLPNRLTQSASAFGLGIMALSASTNIYMSGIVSLPTNLPSTTLGIAAYAGVTIKGTLGATYQIQYSSSLNANWITATNISLPCTPYVWVDTSIPVTGQRFYRSVQLP